MPFKLEKEQRILQKAERVVVGLWFRGGDSWWWWVEGHIFVITAREIQPISCDKYICPYKSTTFQKASFE